jgi:LysM repeat protein
MRMDVKLGVVFALVMVLAAGGYFMFRGEKQTPISLADKNQVSESKTVPNKPGTIAKPAANQPKSPLANNNRPLITPKPSANNANVSARPPAPATTPAVNKPTITPPAPSAAKDAVTNSGPARSGGPAPVTAPPGSSNVSPPAVATNTNPPASVADRPIPAITTPTNVPAAPTAMADRTAPPATGMQIGLTGIPNNASQPTPQNPAPTPAGNMSPLSNSPSGSPSTLAASSPPPTIPSTSNTLPPGIQPTAAPKVDASSTKKSGLADAAVETHKVQVGDSLSSLAHTYYGDSKYAKFLAEANPKIGDANRLKVGTLVSIPPLPADADSRTAGGAATPGATKHGEKSSADGKRTYTVKPGDSFYSIAKSQLGSASRWKELLALNKSTVNGDPTALQPGQRLVLPDSQ